MMGMNRVLFAALLSVLFVGVAVEPVMAQNPKSTKKYKKKRKKLKNRKESSTYVHYSRFDKDGDGVQDYYDHCPATPKGQVVTTFGCPPDTDGDGLYDYEDGCPSEPGPKVNKGCPYADRDGDGILDIDDRCPDTPGEKKWFGCIDKDGDGIPDYSDKCPDVPGIPGLQGCPPEAGDADKDGVLDDVDKCPLTPGVASNHGCPELKPEEKEAIQDAFNNLLFETGKDIIQPSSYPSLNKLATVMINNPGNHLLIEGHTDDVGDHDSNMDLSERRAKAVRNYLVTRRVSDARIEAKGYGETKPVASNDTPDGRQKNRRVEFTLYYE